MRRLVFLCLAVLSVCSCGRSGKQTPQERVGALFREYFKEAALDCRLVSVHAVDTLYALMPADDSVYLELMHRSDSASQAERYVETGGVRRFAEKREGAPSSVFRQQALEYRKNYKGELEAYVYRCVVESSNYELKKDVEALVYLVEPDLSRFRPVPQSYLDQRRTLYLYMYD